MVSFTAGGVFYENRVPDRHKCNLPTAKMYWPLGYAPVAWTCSTCDQVYLIEYSAWTGWWAPEFGMDELVELRGGAQVLLCAWQTWTDCPPNITFCPRISNLLKVRSTLFTHPNPGPRPSYLPPLPQPRKPYGDYERVVLPEKTQAALEPRRRSFVAKMLGQ